MTVAEAMKATITHLHSAYTPEKRIYGSRGWRTIEEGFVTFIDATVEGRPVKISLSTDAGRYLTGVMLIDAGTDEEADLAKAAFVAIRNEWRSTGAHCLDEWCWDNRPAIDVYLAA